MNIHKICNFKRTLQTPFRFNRLVSFLFSKKHDKEVLNRNNLIPSNIEEYNFNEIDINCNYLLNLAFYYENNDYSKNNSKYY